MKFICAFVALMALQPCRAERSWFTRLLTLDTSGDSDQELADSTQKHLREPPNNLNDYYPSRYAIERRTGSKSSKGKGKSSKGYNQLSQQSNGKGKSSKGKGKSSKGYDELYQQSSGKGKSSKGKGKSSNGYDNVEVTQQSDPCTGAFQQQNNGSGKMNGGKMNGKSSSTQFNANSTGGKMNGGKMRSRKLGMRRSSKSSSKGYDELILKKKYYDWKGHKGKGFSGRGNKGYSGKGGKGGKGYKGYSGKGGKGYSSKGGKGGKGNKGYSGQGGKGGKGYKGYSGKGGKGGKGYSRKGGKGGKGYVKPDEVTPDGVLCSDPPTKSPYEVTQQANPTSEPTSPPTSQPTLMPTPKATTFIQQSNPTGDPTSKPSSAPHSAPTAYPFPTAAPSSSPTTTPSMAPSAAPTSAPSNKQCSMTVDMDCVTADGKNCNEIVAPTSLCSQEFDVVNFVYDQQSTCMDSDNFQANSDGSDMSITRAFCEDLEPLEQAVSMECIDSVTSVQLSVSPPFLVTGDSVAVFTTDNSMLPSEILCTLRSASTSRELQKNWVSLSPTVRLKDKFGALQVQACGEKHCLQEANVTYSVTNDGEASFEVIKCLRQKTGEDSLSILSDLPTNPLDVGTTASVSETIMVDTCSFDPLVISLDVEAEPKDGPMCTGNPFMSIDLDPTPTAEPSSSPTSLPTTSPTVSPSRAPSIHPTAAPTASPSDKPSISPSIKPTMLPTKFLHPTQSPTETEAPTSSPSKSPSKRPSSRPSISPTTSPTNSQCSVHVDMSCLTSDGTACESVVPTAPLCNAVFEIVNFVYDSQATCTNSENTQDDDGANICEDFHSLVEQVSIKCFDMTLTTPSELTVQPSVVNTGESFAIIGTNGAELPSTVRCNIEDSTGMPLQTNLINMSGPLRLNEKYGSLQLRSCGDKSCTRDATVSVSITNTGSDSLTVITANNTVTGRGPTSLLPLPSNPLDVDQSSSVSESVRLDVCSQGPIVITTTVLAEPENGTGCGHSPSVTIELDPAPTAEPSSSPSNLPTAAPTASPTAAPSSSPSSTPTASPSKTPSSSPTARIEENNSTPSPTVEPQVEENSSTSAPTDQPSAVPTYSPTAGPTVSPTVGDGCEPAYVYCTHASTCFLDAMFNSDAPVVDASGNAWGWSIFLGVGACDMHCSIYTKATSCDTSVGEQVGTARVTAREIELDLMTGYETKEVQVYSGRCAGNDAGKHLLPENDGSCQKADVADFADDVSTYSLRIDETELSSQIIINEYTSGVHFPWPQGYDIFPLATSTRQYLSIALNVCPATTSASPSASPVEEFVQQSNPTISPTQQPSDSPSAVPTAKPSVSPSSQPTATGSCAPAYVYCPCSSTCFLDPNFNFGFLPGSDNDEDTSCYAWGRLDDENWGWNIALNGDDGLPMQCEIWMGATGCSRYEGAKVGTVAISKTCMTFTLNPGYTSDSYSLYGGACEGSDGGAQLNNGYCKPKDVAEYAAKPENYTYSSFHPNGESTSTFHFNEVNAPGVFPIDSTVTKYLTGFVEVCPSVDGEFDQQGEDPTSAPNLVPSDMPSFIPSELPSEEPSHLPTQTPTPPPTVPHSVPPSSSPTIAHSGFPSSSPTKAPSTVPTKSPSKAPSKSPTSAPTASPSDLPSRSPTKAPTPAPTELPTMAPSGSPTSTPTSIPTASPSYSPSSSPTKAPSTAPTEDPCMDAWVWCPNEQSTCFSDPSFNSDQPVQAWGWSIDVEGGTTGLSGCTGCEIWAESDCQKSTGVMVGRADFAHHYATVSLDQGYVAASISLYGGKCEGSDGGDVSGCNPGLVAQYSTDPTSFPVQKNFSPYPNGYTFTEHDMSTSEVWGDYSIFPLGGQDRRYVSAHLKVCPCPTTAH